MQTQGTIIGRRTAGARARRGLATVTNPVPADGWPIGCNKRTVPLLVLEDTHARKFSNLFGILLAYSYLCSRNVKDNDYGSNYLHSSTITGVQLGFPHQDCCGTGTAAEATGSVLCQADRRGGASRSAPQMRFWTSIRRSWSSRSRRPWLRTW